MASNGELNASAGGVQNQGGGKIVNLGTVLDDLNNAGLVLNYGAYYRHCRFEFRQHLQWLVQFQRDLRVDQQQQRELVGDRRHYDIQHRHNLELRDLQAAGVSFNGTGTIDNENLWKGSWANNGGTINNVGTITGDVTNNSGIINNINGANSTISGNVTANGGIVYSYNPTSTIGGSVSVPGRCRPTSSPWARSAATSS